MSLLEVAIINLAIIAMTIGVAASVSLRFPRIAICCAFAGATALVFFQGLGYFNSVADDSFISFRYARNLADGLGPNWNSTGRVEGYTNFMLVGLLAGSAKLGLSIVISARVIGALSTLATFGIVYRISELWRSEDDEQAMFGQPLVLAATLTLLGVSSGVAYYAFSGLETPLFMFLLTLSAYCYFLEHRGGRVPWSAVTLAAAAMTRPEGLIAVAVTGLFLAGPAIGGSKHDRLRVVRWAALFAMLYGSYYLWRYTYYDYLLPNTFYAKVEPGQAIFTRGAEYLREASAQYLLLPMFAGAAFLLLLGRVRHDVTYIMVLAGTLLIAIVYEGGDFMPYYRFAVPTLPLLYLAGVKGYALVLRRMPRAATFLTGAFILVIAALSLVHDSSRLATDRLIHLNNSSLATWFRLHTPQDFRIGAVAVGVIGFYSERDIIDMAGINDTTIAHTDVPAFGSGEAGHEKYNIDYILEEARPEIIIGFGSGIGPRRQEDQEPTFVAARTFLIGDPRLWEQYDVTWLIHNARWHTFLTRKDVVAELHGPGLISHDNLLANPGNESADAWNPEQSELTASADGLYVSASSAAFGASQTTRGGAVGEGRYVALVWVRGTEESAGGQISVSLSEDGDEDASSSGRFRLTPDWRPIWVFHTLEDPETTEFTLRVVRHADTPAQSVFVLQDAQVHLVEDE